MNIEAKGRGGRRKGRRKGKEGAGAHRANLKTAEAILAKRHTEMAEGRYLDKRKVSRLRWELLCDRYEEWAQVHKARSYRTAVKYQLAMLRERFAGKTLAEVTLPLIERFVVD